MIAPLLLIIVAAWLISLSGWAKAMLLVLLILAALGAVGRGVDDMRTGRRWTSEEGPPVLRIVIYGFLGLLLLALLVRVATSAAAGVGLGLENGMESVR
jgi:hypothetical protein